MSRYINEDRLYSNIEEKYKVAQGDARRAYNDVLDTICEIPTAEVVEVVRCKDCIYYHREIHECEWFSEEPDCGTTGSHVETDDNDFCSYGERRKDGGEIH